VFNGKMGLQAGSDWGGLKERNSVEVAEYAAAKSFLYTPIFVWWSPNFLKKRSRIIAAITKCHRKRSHKSRIEVPKNWDDCVRLEKRITTLFGRMQ
jgi:hypothetical protein